jgi:hypothetical protein
VELDVVRVDLLTARRTIKGIEAYTLREQEHDDTENAIAIGLG